MRQSLVQEGKDYFFFERARRVTSWKPATWLVFSDGDEDEIEDGHMRWEARALGGG